MYLHPAHPCIQNTRATNCKQRPSLATPRRWPLLSVRPAEQHGQRLRLEGTGAPHVFQPTHMLKLASKCLRTVRSRNERPVSLISE